MFIAVLPVIELKGAIPVGISLDCPLPCCRYFFVGSMIPVPFILFAIRPVFNYLKKTSIFKNVVHRLTDKSLSKSGNIQKYGAWGLLLFVAIPLLGQVYGLESNCSFTGYEIQMGISIFIGNLIAGILIMGISNGVFNVIT